MRRHGWPIRYQLAAIVVAPLLALVVASVWLTSSALDRAAEAGRVRQDAAFAVSVTTLVHELQRERGLSGGYVGSGYRNGLDQVTAQRRKADDALRVFAGQAGNVRSALAEASVRAAFADAEASLGGLARQRQAIDNKALDVTGTLSYYTATISKLLAVDQAMSKAIDDPETARISTAFVDLSEGKESGALERGFMNSVFSKGRFGSGDYSRLLTLVAEQDAWLALFRSTANPDVLRYYDQHVSGPAVARAAALRAEAVTEGAEGRDPTVQPSEWWSVMTVKIDLIRDVELRMTEELRGRAAAVSASANAAMARDVTVTLLVLGLSFVLSALTARRMARTLRGLRDAAHHAADVRLPAVVAALNEGRAVDLVKETEPVHIDSDDEIGETAHAFNRVHSVAVQLTVEQAGLRRSLSDTLLNLARRSQTLIHQQLELIDEMERSESDGKKLDSLFRIDHIATRMRRHTEDLIVLSGAAPSRGWSAPVPLRDVVRGAIAEVENYSRVQPVRLPEVAVVGHAVGDLLHLLAELIENGTRFSPPDAPVVITAGEVGKGYAIEIEDRGLGMTAGEMARHNERLDAPPAFDLSTSDRLGLHVVARLAARHSVQVCLRDSPFGGVTAVVLVGRELIRSVDDSSHAERDVSGIPAQRVIAEEAAGRWPIGGDGHHGAALPGEGRPGGGKARWNRLAALPAGVDGRTGGARHAAGAYGPEPAVDSIGDTGRASVAPVRPGLVDLPGTPRRALPPPPPPTSRPPSTSQRPAAHRPTGSPAPGRTGGGPAEAVPDGLTADGLPRRVPRKHLTAELRREPGAVIGGVRTGFPSSGATAPPSPEEIRAMLSGYQTGFDRGRSDQMNQAASDGRQAYDQGQRRAGRQLGADDRDSGVDAAHAVADRVLDYPTKDSRRS